VAAHVLTALGVDADAEWRGPPDVAGSHNSRSLGTSASAGSSRSVRRNSVDIRISTRAAYAVEFVAPRDFGVRRLPSDIGAAARRISSAPQPGRAISSAARSAARSPEVSMVAGIIRWRSFVAVGDSFTEGLDDPRPDGVGYSGWADLVAARLAARHYEGAQDRSAEDDGRDFCYANLAIRGRLFDAIVAEQVPAALRMRPDLISFAGGGNDVLRRSFNPSAMRARFDETVRTLRASGAEVLLFRFADVTRRLPARRLILPRVEILNRAVGEVAEKHGARLVDLWCDEEFYNPRLWSDDRLHLSTAGHRRVAAHVLAALAIEPDAAWLAAPEAPERHTWVNARASDARWVGQHLAPWARRRLTGRSSGDAVSAKRPTLTPLR
jgi:lysophospholipase L1-like esterase